MAKKFTIEETKQIKHDYENGMKLYEISGKYNRNSCSIIGLLKRLGVFKSSNNRWAYEEETLLKSVYPTATKKDILKYFPNRTIDNIHCKASKLGLEKINYHWNDEDIEILKNNYGIYTAKEIQPMLNGGHTIGAIKCKAQKLGLCYMKKWTDEENKILRNSYSSLPMNKVANLLPNRTVNSIQIHAKLLGLTANYAIENYYSEEQCQFIKDNWRVMTDKELAQRLGKCVSGVMEQRRKMGLYYLNKEYTDYEDFTKLFRGHIGSWKTESMKKCNYQCVLTGSKDYVVHHLHGFNLILKETYALLESNNILRSKNITDYSKKELEVIIKEFLKIHNLYPLGICVKKDIHDLFHMVYGSGGNTEYQWNEFVNDYKKGVYG